MPSKWQPIETAPRNGTDILLGFAGQKRPPVVAGWFDLGEREVNEWWADYDSTNMIKGTPTHWMPIPPLEETPDVDA